MSNFVAVHLERTGPDSAPGDLVALAAVRVSNNIEADRLDLRARPPGGLSPLVARTAGITEADLAGAPPPAEAARAFFRFAGSDPVVSCRPQADEACLRRHARRGLRNVVLGLGHLARIVLPAAPSHELSSLARHFGLGPPAGVGRSPMDRALLTARAWLRLSDAAGDLSLIVLRQMLRLLEGTDHPLRPLFEDAERRALRKAFGTAARSYEDLARDFSGEIRRRPHDPPSTPPKPLDAAETAALFRQGGPLQKAHSAYENRSCQVRMAEAVCEAFNASRFLMVEAGTGVGKSLAYLVPSVLWSRLNHDKIVISTNTKNLQEQLFHKDIPFVARALDVKFDAALIKGRGNYLCVRKFLYMLREADREMTPEERVELLPLVVWFPETDTGDLAENTGFLTGRAPELWSRLSTGANECLGPTCRRARSCFVRLARARALAADVVVANHAVVFSEMGMESVVLPPYTRIIFDEAHNVENVATDHLARRVSPLRVFLAVNRLHRALRDGTGRGLLASLRFQIRRAGPNLQPAVAEELERQVQPVAAAIESVSRCAQDFAAAVRRLVPAATDSRLRYTAGARPTGWPNVASEAAALQEQLGLLVHRLHGLKVSLETLGAGVDEADTFVGELAAAAERLAELGNDLQFCIDASDPDYVYWAECDAARDVDHALCAAPLEIRHVMAANVYDKMDSVIFCSATLTVGGRFDFMRARLGLEGQPPERLDEINVGTSFDFPRQALLGVVNYLPDPTDAAAFTRSFCKAVIDVLRATRGRALVLFTSHRMLRDAHLTIKEALQPEGILVLAQGIDGERSQLTRTFQEDISSVLLGVQSFWEGVDVVGEALSCLVLAKLPFQVHTDPVVQARCELIESRGGNSFYEYMVPNAVIRLKQGFGRLIRTRTDRGVVLIADRRVVTKSYGRPFLASLPTPAHVFQEPEAMARTIRDFLDRPGAEGSGA